MPKLFCGRKVEMSAVSATSVPFPETLNTILSKIRDKAHIIRTIDALRSTTEGNVREGYKIVIENELFAMMRLIDSFKIEVCNGLTEVHQNALFHGSIFPLNP
jgi:hypothetical protein